MRAMILAAGLGQRMRPLTDHTPKPLLKAGGEPLIAYHINALARAGIGEIVINVSHLGEQIIDYCGDGKRWGVSLLFSEEAAPLETAGGIVQALPLLGDQPFVLVNGDVWTDFDFTLLNTVSAPDAGAHLVFVDNPPQHPNGDFSLAADGSVQRLHDHKIGLTYAGIGLYCPGMFTALNADKRPLRPLFEQCIDSGKLTGQHYRGQWWDVGTPERLQALNERLK